MNYVEFKDTINKLERDRDFLLELAEMGVDICGRLNSLDTAVDLLEVMFNDTDHRISRGIFEIDNPNWGEIFEILGGNR